MAVMVVLVVMLAATPLTAAAVATDGQQLPRLEAAPGGMDAVDTAGIALVSSLQSAKPETEAQAQALSDALDFAESHPDDVGYPWIDPSSKDLVLSTASAAGVDLVDQFADDLKVPHSVRHVSFSFGKLETTKHEVTTLMSAGIPGADLIYMAGPDAETNRVVIVVSAPNEPLFKALADRFGTEAVEVRIDASMRGAQPTFDRQHDISPFWGGASIQSAACSDGIPWQIGSSRGLLTAAHCFSSGGSAKIGDFSGAGSVRANDEENWDPVHGTQYYTGQSTLRGDVALIRLNSGYTTSAYIFRGGVNSQISWSVLSWYQRYAQSGDVLNVSGRASGETGPYTVDLTNFDVIYNPPSDLWARNISSALSLTSPCVAGGDSGGTLFSLVTGGVKEAGVLSGSGPGPCRIYFTPIYRSYLGLPGSPLMP